MKYKDVTIIEGAEYVKSGKIKVTDKNALTEPLPIGDIEYWEDRLSDANIPYVLAEVSLDYRSDTLYDKGYVIFVKSGSMTLFTKSFELNKNDRSYEEEYTTGKIDKDLLELAEDFEFEQMLNMGVLK